MASRCRSAASKSALRTYSSTNANSNFFCGASRSLAGSPSKRLRLLRRPTPVSTSEKSGSVDKTATWALLRMERADEIEAAQPFVTEHRKTGIWPGQTLQRLRAEEQGRGRHAAAGRGKRRAEMMTRKQPSPELAAHRLAEDRNPIVRRPHALDRVASGPRPGRIVLQVFQLLGPQNVVMAHNRCDLVIALAARGRADEIVQSAPAFQPERAEVYSNPRNESDR